MGLQFSSEGTLIVIGLFLILSVVPGVSKTLGEILKHPLYVDKWPRSTKIFVLILGIGLLGTGSFSILSKSFILSKEDSIGVPHASSTSVHIQRSPTPFSTFSSVSGELTTVEITNPTTDILVVLVENVSQELLLVIIVPPNDTLKFQIPIGEYIYSIIKCNGLSTSTFCRHQEPQSWVVPHIFAKESIEVKNLSSSYNNVVVHKDDNFLTLFQTVDFPTLTEQDFINIARLKGSLTKINCAINETCSIEEVECEPSSRLKVGNWAQVCTWISKSPLLVRNGPGVRYSYEYSLNPGEVVLILDGPVCDMDSGWWYWKIKTQNKRTGWVSEGGDSKDPYFLCPYP